MHSARACSRRRTTVRLASLVSSAIALQCVGCSFVFTSGPPPRDERPPPPQPIDCSTSRVPPLLDTAFTGFQAFRIVTAVAASNGDYSDAPISRTLTLRLVRSYSSSQYRQPTGTSRPRTATTQRTNVLENSVDSNSVRVSFSYAPSPQSAHRTAPHIAPPSAPQPRRTPIEPPRALARRRSGPEQTEPVLIAGVSSNSVFAAAERDERSEDRGARR